MKFGDNVFFNKEYVSCKPKTISTNSSDEDMRRFFKENNICLLDEIKSKEIKNHKKPKEGLFLGTTKINLSFYYDWEDSIDTGEGVIPEKYFACKSNFIDVAEVRVENIKKTYYVPIDNLWKWKSSF